MIDILSLPRRNTNQALLQKAENFRSGLPINSLPGWEHIPLNCKLPMLKCPGNQVIFSKNKIGQEFKSTKQEFDSSVRDKIPEYNPLHDSNLKTFYSNERNLKRLRENGEITQTNDVICNLKDFNEYRQNLHKSNLYYVLQAYKQREAEQHDRMLIANAEAITKRDHMNLAARHHCHDEILERRKHMDEQRHQRFKRLYKLTEDKFIRLESMAEMQKEMLEHTKTLNTIRMQHHLDACQDVQRKHLIKLKKLFQYKKDRFKKNMRNLVKRRIAKANEMQTQSWRKRMDERISNQKRIEVLLNEVEKERLKFIENHKAAYKIKWERIQEEIRLRARRTLERKQPKKRRKKKRKPIKKELTSFCDEYQQIFEGLLDTDLCEALNAAIVLEGTSSITFAPDDPIYKAAQYILNYILKRFDKDLSKDACVVKTISQRMENFMNDAKKFVFSKASQIVAFARDHRKNLEPTTSTNSRVRQSRISHVSFNAIASTIGFGSYDVHPFVDIRPVSERRPTPAGSLASLVVSQIEEQVVQDRIKITDTCRHDIVFVEHYIVKFKRELLVGMDKQVFAAIKCHFGNKILEVRKELLELDHEFLINQVVKGILSYAVNPLNFQTSVKLAVSVLSSQVIQTLQQGLLRPNENPRGFALCAGICSPTETERAAMCL